MLTMVASIASTEPKAPIEPSAAGVADVTPLPASLPGGPVFLNSVTPIRNTYVPISQQQAVLGETIPLATYALAAEAENGYIILYHPSNRPPTLGYLTKRNRLGNPTATVRLGEIQVQGMVNEPIVSGYIPLLTNECYRICSDAGAEYGIHYAFRSYYTNLSLAKTNFIMKSSAQLHSEYLAQKSREELVVAEHAQYQAKREEEEKHFQNALIEAGQARTDDDAMALLQSAVAKYPLSSYAYLARNRILQITAAEARRAESERQKVLENEAMNSAIAGIPRAVNGLLTEQSRDQSGEQYWAPGASISKLFAVTSWEIVKQDVVGTRALVRVRVDSSNKGGQPIRQIWKIVMVYEGEWKVLAISD